VENRREVNSNPSIDSKKEASFQRFKCTKSTKFSLKSLLLEEIDNEAGFELNAQMLPYITGTSNSSRLWSPTPPPKGSRLGQRLSNSKAGVSSPNKVPSPYKGAGKLSLRSSRVSFSAEIIEPESEPAALPGSSERASRESLYELLRCDFGEIGTAF
jgi:hypothetical protein